MEIATLELLEKADFSPSQAKAIAQAIAQEQAKTVSKETFEAHRQQLATREDIYKIKGELIQWMVGLMLAQAGFFMALLKLFPHN